MYKIYKTERDDIGLSKTVQEQEATKEKKNTNTYSVPGNQIIRIIVMVT